MQFDGPKMIRDRSRLRRMSAALVGTAALLGGLLVLDVQPSGALVDVSNVSASLDVPSTADGSFTATGTITNAGTVPQQAGATVTIRATGGAVTGLVAPTTSDQCQVNDGVAVCTTSEILNPAVLGGTKSFSVRVTPSTNAPVDTTVTTLANQPDLNAPASPADDTVTKTTVVKVSNVSASLGVPDPPRATGPFTATGTVTNSGNVAQVAGSKVTISATGGAVTGLVAPTTSDQCQVNDGVAVCTAGALNPGTGQSFAVTVAPSTSAPSVDTTVTTLANQPDLNAPASPADDTVTRTTDIYSLQVDLTSHPTEVRRGSGTLLTAAVTNSGTAQSGVTLTIETGGTVDERLALDGCEMHPSGDPGTVICRNISLGNGETKSFTVAVTTPSTGNTMRSEAIVTGANGSRGSDTEYTTLSDIAKAWVPPGGQLCFDSETQSSCFNVPLGWTGGLVVTLGNVPLPDGRTAAEALWDKSELEAHNDLNNPLVWNISFNQKAACNGSGSLTCHRLAWGTDTNVAPEEMERCPSFSTNTPNPPQMANPDTPCLNFIFRNTSGFVTYQVAWLVDAFTVPIINSKVG